MSAAIIGAGITGLSLAYFLQQKGHKVAVFEKENHAGGLASTFKIENAPLEKLYHHFFAQDKAALDLLGELGIKERFFWVYPRMGYFSGGKIFSFTTPFDLLRFSPLSFIERLKLGIFSRQVLKDKNWQMLENITAEEWLNKKIGPHIYHTIFKPVLTAKFGSYAKEIPAAWMWARLVARARSRGRLGTREKLGYLNGSYQVLIDALVDRIIKGGGEIKFNCGEKVYPLSDYDATIITTPNAYNPGIKYLGNICLVLKLERSFSKYYWTNIADPEIPFCALIEHTNAFDDPGFNGYKIVYLSNYVDLADPVWGLSDRALLEKYLGGMRKIRPDFSSRDVVEYFVFRERYAQPLPTLGHSKRIPPFKVGEKLYLVSNMQIYPEDRGVNDSIKLAWKFAEQF